MKKILKCLIIVPVLFLLITLFGCSKVMANEKLFYFVKEWEYSTIFFEGTSVVDGNTKGYYKYVGSFMESGFFESQTESKGITAISVSINKSSFANRVGLNFICTVWANDSKINPEYWNKKPDASITWLTNAKILTGGLAETDTIPTWGIPTKVESNKTTWSKVKQLFITK